MKDTTDEELELIKESVCDGCKGEFLFYETGCYKKCDAFQRDLEEFVEERSGLCMKCAGEVIKERVEDENIKD